MYSFSFPKMVSNTSAKIVSNHEATSQNLKLLLMSDKYSLFGDPYYGTSLKKLIFEPNNVVIKDLIIDDIYIAILTFMPQIKVNRKDITVTSNFGKVYVNIKALNLLDYTVDLYNINLTGSEEK